MYVHVCMYVGMGSVLPSQLPSKPSGFGREAPDLPGRGGPPELPVKPELPGRGGPPDLPR